MTIQKIITLFVLIIIAILFFSLGSYIQKEGKPITDFCTEHYKNKTFLETTTYFTQDEPSEPLRCQTDTWRTGKWFRYCNSTCFENFNKCLEENATDEQIYFMNKCHWMGPDYIILVGTVIFKFAFPSFCLIMFIFLGIIIFRNKEENENRRHRT